MSERTCHVCPLRPPNSSLNPEPDVGWDSLDDADVLVDPASILPADRYDDEEVSVDDRSSVRVPLPVPAPYQPSKKELERHNLTHADYKGWCPHCVAGRRPNAQHRNQSGGTRKVPLFCADYAYLRDERDDDLLTAMIGKLFPAKAFFATGCDVKGPSDEAVGRLANFFKEAGFSKLVYKTDQESALKATIEEALVKVGRSGTFEAFEAVPEYSAVGESASNGKAERAVQAIEDLLRTLKSALESRIQARIPSQHPVLKWMIEHAASILNRYCVNSDGVTPYEAMPWAEANTQGRGVWRAGLLQCAQTHPS